MTNTTIKLYQKTTLIKTTGKTLCKITSEIQTIINESAIQTGICHIFIRHTSASLLIQEEDAKPDVAAFFATLVPESGEYLLAGQGLDDMPAHIRCALTQTSEQIPITNGILHLGKLQDIYIWEHRQSGYNREIIINIIGY